MYILGIDEQYDGIISILINIGRDETRPNILSMSVFRSLLNEPEINERSRRKIYIFEVIFGNSWSTDLLISRRNELPHFDRQNKDSRK